MSGHLTGGRYRLRERLGHGGMSVVWRATDEVLGRDVAVKVLAPQLADNPDVLRRLRDEARAAAALRHPHIVEVYDYGEDLLPYVVMELVEGRTLADLLRDGPLPWRTAVAIGAQVAAALGAAHAQGVVHCDVKPANVMVTGTGVKLVDFGIAAAAGQVEDPEAEVLGTPAYLSPERIAGGPIVAATDVYAVGLLLHLALAGHPPWQASTVTQMLRAHVYAEPAPLPAVPGLPSSVTRLVRRCLSKQPGDRPSATDVAERLGRAAGLPPVHLLDVSTLDTHGLGRPGARAAAQTLTTAVRDGFAAAGRAASARGGLVAAWRANAGRDGRAAAQQSTAARDRLPSGGRAASVRGGFVAGRQSAAVRGGLAAARRTSAGRAIAALPAGRRRVVVGAMAAVGLVGGGMAVRAVGDNGPGAPAAAVAATPAPSAAKSASAKPVASRPQTCMVRYALRGTTAGKASAKVTVHNTGKVPVSAWKLSFALPSGQRLIKGTSATWRQDGRAVVAAGGKLPAGGKAASSFTTTSGEVAALPVTFRLNGTTCQAQMSVQAASPPQRTAAPPAPPASKSKPKTETKHHGSGGSDDEGDQDEGGDEDE